MGIEDYFKTLFAALIGKAQMQQQPQGAQALSQALGGSSPMQQPSTVQQQTLTGGPTFAPDAQGNLQIVDDPNQPLPPGVYGANAYMNQQNLPQPAPMTPQQKALKIGMGVLGGLPPAPSPQMIQQLFSTPEGVNALSQALGGVYGGGNP